MTELFEKAASISMGELQSHPSLIINAFDKEHTILLWNNKCATYFGIPAEKAIGEKLESVLPWVRESENLSFIDRGLMGIRMEILKVKYQLKSGHYDQMIIPVKNQQGEVVAVLNMVADLQEDAAVL